jgi:hypothetical protein
MLWESPQGRCHSEVGISCGKVRLKPEFHACGRLIFASLPPIHGPPKINGPSPDRGEDKRVVRKFPLRTSPCLSERFLEHVPCVLFGPRSLPGVEQEHFSPLCDPELPTVC